MPARIPGNGDRLIEWLFAFMMMGWGVWLINPGWSSFNNPQYAVLATLANEQVWGAWSFSVGFVRGVALYINGSHYRSPLIRLICSILGLVWWFTLIYLFLITGIKDPIASFAWYPIFAAFEAICCWRSASDAFMSRAFKRPSWGKSDGG